MGNKDGALRIFGVSIIVTVLALGAAYWYGAVSAIGGLTALTLCVILGVLEVSLSFDNAVINATILQKMSEFWQKIFLTVGILIAVFGMRVLFPLAIIWVTAGLGPVEAFKLALNPPTDGSPTYESLITDAHPQIAAFGGTFLLMLFLNFMFETRDHNWLGWIERPLAKAGKLDMLTVIVTSSALLFAAYVLADETKISTVLAAGLVGMVLYIVVDGLGSFFHPTEHGPSGAVKATGKAGFFLFLYLEILDASFSFDGVIGAFAITADPIIIMLGLGFIGAMYVRSMTVYMVRRGTLQQFIYLEHGAFWAIGALAAILLVTVGHIHIPEVVTGFIGIVLIGLAVLSSIRHSRRNPAVESEEDSNDAATGEAEPKEVPVH